MMFIINMRIFKNILVFLPLFTFINFINASPTAFLRLEHRTLDEDLPSFTENSDISVTSSTFASKEDTYDQRQNGTENYRVQIKGLVLFLGPADSFIVAGGANDLLSGINTIDGIPVEKPKPKPDETKPNVTSVSTTSEIVSVADTKPVMPMKKSVHKPHLKLVSLLAPFLKRIAIY